MNQSLEITDEEFIVQTNKISPLTQVKNEELTTHADNDKCILQVDKIEFINSKMARSECARNNKRIK